MVVVAATNKPGVLDPALMRPGRLDHILYVGPPDLESRKEILKIWFGKSVIDAGVGVDKLALLTDGYTGAELVSICETAADAALDEEEETGLEAKILWEHFEHALNQVQKQVSAALIMEYEQWGKDYAMR